MLNHLVLTLCPYSLYPHLYPQLFYILLFLLALLPLLFLFLFNCSFCCLFYLIRHCEYIQYKRINANLLSLLLSIAIQHHSFCTYFFKMRITEHNDEKCRISEHSKKKQDIRTQRRKKRYGRLSIF